MIRYRYEKLDSRAHCLIYSTEGQAELESWGKRHDMRPEHIRTNPLPHFCVTGFQARGKPVDSNTFKRDVKNYKKRGKVKRVSQVTPAPPPPIVIEEPTVEEPTIEDPPQKEEQQHVEEAEVKPMKRKPKKLEIAQIIDGQHSYLELRRGDICLPLNKAEAIVVSQLLEANAMVLPEESKLPDED